MYKICILEDQQEMINRIKDLLLNFSFQKDIDFEINSYTKTDEDFYNKKNNLYLLDIILNEENGIDIAQKITTLHPDSQIIFITNHSQFIFDSRKVHPYDFVRKEYLEKELTSTLNDFYQQYLNEEKYLSIIQSKRTIYLKIKDILYLQSEDHECHIYTFNQKYTLRTTLEALIQQLPEGYLIHRSYYVMYKAIKEIYQDSLLTINQQLLPVSRRKVSALKKAYRTYLLDNKR